MPSPQYRREKLVVMSRRMTALAAVWALAALALLAVPTPAHAQPPPKLVLLVHGGTELFPGNHDFDAAIREKLFSRASIKVEAHSEYLESEEFGEAAFTSLRQAIEIKFRGRSFDLVIANTSTALQFVLRYRDELFRGVPVVFAAVNLPPAVVEGKVAGVTGIVRAASIAETVELILKLHPGTRRVHVIRYGPTLPGYHEHTEQSFAPFSSRVKVTFSEETTVSEMLATLKTLPPDTIVFRNRFSAEAAGRVLNDDFIPGIAELSTVPVYTSQDRYLGTGVVGGMMRDSNVTGQRLAEIALRVLDGTPPESMPIEAVPVRPVFDWRQLRRWNIDELWLPEGSDVRFREPTLWAQYSGYIVATAFLLVAQLVLIAVLLGQRARLRKADNTIRGREALLRKSYDRIRQLAGRLINAQEAARADIARDLHDDVSQKLAYVSIGVNSLRTASGDIQDPQTQQALDELDRETRNTFEGIRRLSHDLHPAPLRLLGLAPALRSHCAEIAKRQGIEVDFAAGTLATVHPDVSVCLFRIAQESIRNALVHGGATHLTVTIQRSDDQIQMTVADDGEGFDVNEVQSSGGGLGLVTMEERVNLVGGSVTVASARGSGTTVRVHAPATPAAALARA
jgi:signal transduction histidine kinase